MRSFRLLVQTRCKEASVSPVLWRRWWTSQRRRVSISTLSSRGLSAATKHGRTTRFSMKAASGGTRLVLCPRNRHLLAHRSRFVSDSPISVRIKPSATCFLTPAARVSKLSRRRRALNGDGVLSKVKTTGETERQRTIFYTALWRSLCRMTDIAEDGRYYSGFDHAVHNTDGHDFYVDDGLGTPFAPCILSSFCWTDTVRRTWSVRIFVCINKAAGFRRSHLPLANRPS